MKTRTDTLCFVYEHPRILLGMKKRDFGKGKWNGFGGKVMAETLEDAARRETREECGLEIKSMEKRGILEFEFVNNPELIQVHVFQVLEYSGEPSESEEMRPKWFHIDEIPFAEMWPDDVYWMPLFLRGKKFRGKFTFGEGGEILEKELEEVEKLD